MLMLWLETLNSRMQECKTNVIQPLRFISDRMSSANHLHRRVELLRRRRLLELLRRRELPRLRGLLRRRKNKRAGIKSCCACGSFC